MDKLNKHVVIVLSEIYGINEFIKDTGQKLKKLGYDLICPDIIGRSPFPY